MDPDPDRIGVFLWFDRESKVMESVGNMWLWLGFFAFALTMIAVDLFLLGGRKAHKVSLREAGAWSVV